MKKIEVVFLEEPGQADHPDIHLLESGTEDLWSRRYEELLPARGKERDWALASRWPRVDGGERF